MIYLITGIPGSGKTLYAVSTLIQSLMKDNFINEKGETITRRLVVDGIPQLALEHEPLCETVVQDKNSKVVQGDGVTVKDGGCGVGNWWEWCKPGDVIVIDECQRIWRPRAMGAKPPQMVTELETHRHYGVDFVIITQSPMLIDQNVRRLVGRHQHVRRLFGMKRAIIYDWDGCQSDVHRVSSASKTMWSYPKNAFKLYKSAELHTKQKQKFPIWVALPIVAIVAGLALGPKAYASLSGAMTGKGVSSAAAVPAVPASKPMAAASVPATVIASPVVSAVVAPAVVEPARPMLSGCIKSPTRCVCYDTSGAVMPEDPQACTTHVAGNGDLPKPLPSSIPDLNHEVVRTEQAAQDGAVFASMSRKTHSSEKQLYLGPSGSD